MSEARQGRASRLAGAALGHTMDLRGWKVFARVRARLGARRVRETFVPILIASVTAGVAYYISAEVLGHEVPMFAPIAVWLALGFTPDRQIRRTIELGVGCTVGVWLGELFVQLLGAGALQIALVLLVSAVLAQFIDRGGMLTIQAGIQSVIIVAMPTAMIADGAIGRWSDALVGAALAIIVTALIPVDVVKRPRAMANGSLTQVANMLGTLARGLRDGDPQLAADALTMGRAFQPRLDAWAAAMRSASELVRVNPALRGDRATVAELNRAATLVDHAMRNARVVSRRAVVAIEEDGASPDVASHVDDLAAAFASLAGAFGRGDPPDHARAKLQEVAAALMPDDYASRGWRQQTLVSLLRSLAVDGLEITGMTHGEAVDELAED